MQLINPRCVETSDAVHVSPRTNTHCNLRSPSFNTFNTIVARLLAKYIPRAVGPRDVFG